MGKQRRNQKIRTARPESVNAVNWQARALELYELKLITLAQLGVDPNYRPPRINPSFNPTRNT